VVYSQDQFKGYADQFVKNDITGETLLVLTDGNLKNDLGIDKLGHRIAFLNLVQTLNPEKITKVEEVRKAKEKQEAEERKAKEQQKAEEVRKAEEARKAKEKQKEEVRKAEERRVEEFKKVVNRNNPIADAWTPEHTFYWVMLLNDYKEYAQKFRDEDVTGEVLLNLTENDLANTFGMKKFGQRKIFMNKIQSLNGKESRNPEEQQKPELLTPADVGELVEPTERLALLITMNKY